ncbi:DUF502 domain-containing protein [Desulfoprunum benzoelyticum]|uniref:Putative membrane protein n=1 Tax=Desulfoprunum benzoelyticum TaxID=1506996 RepID=A0A840V0S4_9BACT|nr:DUF502 domain-containing protein [Desulfoprunum benzoelyticum]MBB5347420.1 putative membrane protein [Desulfoprunum benzoelyticum]MBM9529700.1 DUF502 domain-containing protein [Desulfoprunum benzoelyticum]
MAKTMTRSGHDRRDGAHFARYTLIGFFTVAPLWVTWLVFDFLLGILAGAGTPLLLGSARIVGPFSATLADWLRDTSFQRLVAVIMTLALFYGIGLFASFVVGRRLIELFEAILARLPLVQTIYGATKRFLQTLRQPPVSGQRVVLISFPTPEMKAVGFVTRIIRDEASGCELAAVYVPTSPNPTSGYIEIVPMSEVVQTDWSIEEAMNFVMTGGTNAPDSIRFTSKDAGGKDGKTDIPG